MAEIFRRKQPEVAHAWTGERLVTGIGGSIEMEHLHRYLIARDLCRGRDVLDVASGEGYGTALLAQLARSAIGLDIDAGSVSHAARWYGEPNLHYVLGSADRLPLDDACVDVVVSFETLEHIEDHAAFLAEIRRVLRPGGLLVISTPDADIYSGPGTTPNPFHVHELARPEFTHAIANAFGHAALFRQRVMIGSAVVPDRGQGVAGDLKIYEQRDTSTFEAHESLPRAPYLLAIASDAELPAWAGSLFVTGEDLAGGGPLVRAELARLQHVEETSREQGALLEQLAEERTAARREAAATEDDAASLRAALAQQNEAVAAERLQWAERAKAREDHTACLADSEAIGTLARQQAVTVHRLELALACQAEALQADNLKRDSARRETELLKAELETCETEAARERVRLEDRLAEAEHRAMREQAAATLLVSELDATRADLARVVESYRTLAALIPGPLRRLVPAWARRSIKSRLGRP